MKKTNNLPFEIRKKSTSNEALATQLAENMSQLKNNALNIFSVAGKDPDGVTADNTRIQLAIQTAHNTGVNAVFIPSGVTYMIDVQNPIIVPSNMTILGVKGETLLKVIPSSVKNSANATTMGINSMFVPGDLTTKLCYTYSNMGTNIHFDGLVLDGNYSAINQTGFDATANSKGINASYVDNISITHCKIRNFLGSGIYTAGCSRQIITDNVCHDNGYLSVPASKNGISLAGWYDNGGPYGLYYDAIVSRNIVHNNHDEGIMFSYQKRILISDNIVHDNGDRGIEGDASFQTTDSGDNVPGDVSIVNNFVYDNATHGITIDSSNNQKIKISGNTVRNCQSYGISVNQSSGAEVKISDNLLFNVGYKSDGNLYHGIQVNADEITVQNNTLNKVGVGSSSPGSGIAISRGLNILVTGNKVSAAQVHGISVNPVNQSAIGTHVNSVIVSSNIINKSKAHGINIGGSMPSNTNYNRIRQITINGNNVFDYNEGNAAHQGYGIIIRSDVNADSVVVNGNTVYEDRATRLGAGAIFFQSTTNGKIVFASVTGNEISNGSDWVALDGYQYITYATVENNSLYGQRIVRGTAPPTTNIWQTGDRVINTAPSAGGYLGWVCIANGTPGTWKGYGAIQA
jgi:parallel beta-helix repeat protein